MTIEDDIAFLERIAVLQRLGGGALRSLAIAAETQSLQPGEVLFKAGETAEGAFILRQGSVTLRLEQAGQAEVVAGPGTLLGEAALLAPTRRPATAIAREPSTFMRVPRATFLKILESYPDAAQRLRTLLASRSDQWAREIENVRATLTGDEPAA